MSMEEYDFGVANGALVKFYEDADAKLTKAIKQNVDDFNRLRMGDLQIQVREILAQLSEESTGWAESRLIEIMDQAIDETYADLQAINYETTAKNRAFSRLNRMSVETLVADATEDLAKAVADSERNIVRRLRAAELQGVRDRMVSRRLAQGMVRGEGARKQAKAIEEILQKPMVNIINGRRINAVHYSRMVAVTRTREAATLGVINTMIHHGIDLVRVSSHPHKKDICTPFDGKIFSISGQDRRFPRLDQLPNGGPPFHPFCLHVLLPFVIELSSEEEIARGSGVSSKFLDVEKNAKLDRLVQDDHNLKTVTHGGDPKI